MIRPNPPDRPDTSAAEDLDAGDFGGWLVEVQAAIAGGRGSDVPCGSCTACCTSGQFVHIAPDESDTLAHVPPALVFAAPGLPNGHVLLGYDEHGRCPMLGDGACSIYAHRPRTCRTYDCRVFPAADVEPDPSKVEIGRRTARWRFEVATLTDRTRLDAVRAAAAFLRDRAGDLDARAVRVPDDPTQVAVLAIELHATFLDETSEVPARVDPDVDAVVAALRRVREVHRPR